MIDMADPNRVRVYLPSGGTATCSKDQAERCRYLLVDEDTQPEEEPSATPTPSSAELRTWAQENDVPCPRKGKVPASVVEAYQNAH